MSVYPSPPEVNPPKRIPGSTSTAFFPSFCAVYAAITPADVPPYTQTSASMTCCAKVECVIKQKSTRTIDFILLILKKSLHSLLEPLAVVLQLLPKVFIFH